MISAAGAALDRSAARLPRREDAASRRRRGHVARRVPDRAGTLGLRARRPRSGVRHRRRAVAADGRGDGCARAPRRGAAPVGSAHARTARRARPRLPLRGRRAAAHARARGDGGRRRQDRHLPHGRDHGASLRADRGARVDRARARRRGVRARLDAAGGARPLRDARADAGAEGEDRLLDRHQGLADDPRRASDRPRDRGVAGADEAREHVPRPAAGDARRGRPVAHDDQPGGRRDGPAVDVEPEPPGDPRPHRARARDPVGVRRRGRQPAASPPTTRRSSSASSPTCRASRS